MARIDRLRPREKQTLQTAAIIGRAFQIPVLTAMLSSNNHSNALEGSLMELQRREFIHPQTGTTGQVFFFQNALTQEVAYNSLLIARRRELHRLAGEAIEKLMADRLSARELSATLAYHFERAGVNDKALYHLIVAADHAVRLYANPEAIDFYHRALALSEKTQPSPETLVQIHAGMGEVFFRQGEYAPALEHLGKALQYSQDPHQRATLHRKQGQVYEKWGHYEQAKEQMEAGLSEMRSLLDASEAARIYAGLGLIHYRLGNLDSAIQLGMLALEMLENLGDKRGIAQAANNLSILYCTRGDHPQAIAFHKRCLTLREQEGDIFGLAASHNNLGFAYRYSGDFTQALKHYQRSLELFERVGNPHGMARAYDNLSGLYMEMGQQENAMKYLKKAVTLISEVGADEHQLQPEMWQSGVW
jgi:tetratricopeptide (TPR) repeat protein